MSTSILCGRKRLDSGEADGRGGVTRREGAACVAPRPHPTVFTICPLWEKQNEYIVSQEHFVFIYIARYVNKVK